LTQHRQVGFAPNQARDLRWQVYATQRLGAARQAHELGPIALWQVEGSRQLCGKLPRRAAFVRLELAYGIDGTACFASELGLRQINVTPQIAQALTE
jgi:hypothetical protein